MKTFILPSTKQITHRINSKRTYHRKLLTLLTFLFISIQSPLVLACPTNYFNPDSSDNIVCLGQQTTVTPDINDQCLTLINTLKWEITDPYGNISDFISTNPEAPYSFTPTLTGVYHINYSGFSNVNQMFGSCNTSWQITVINQAPQGHFLLPTVFCANDPALIKFELEPNTSSTQIMVNQSWINFGDNNVQYLTSMQGGPGGIGTFQQLLGNGLLHNYPGPGNYTVNLVLVNACGPQTFTQTISVVSSLTLSVSPITSCPGSNTPLNLSVNPPGVMVSWSQGSNNLGTGNPLALPMPSVNTNYSATPPPPMSGATSQPISLPVTINPLQPLIINGPTTNCLNNTLQYSIGNSNSAGSFFTWSVTGGSVISANNNSSQVTIQWSGAPGSISVSSTNPFYSNASLTFTPCCSSPMPSVAFYNQDYPSGNPNQMYNVSNNLPSNIIGLLSGTTAKTIAIDNTFTVNNNLVLNNTTILMGINAKIVILSGAKLSIKGNSLVKARCVKMWDKIEIQGGGELIVENSVIQDGINAIVSNDGGTFKIYGGSVLNKNYKHITVNSFNGNHSGFIKNTRITCRQSATTASNDLLLSPYANQRSLTGIEINGVSNITIGESTAGQTNFFDNMSNGVRVTGSSIHVYNNEFKNIINRAIFVFNSSVSSAVNIGGTNSNQGNVIYDSKEAIYLDGKLEANVLRNTIYNISLNGIYILRNNHRINILYNKLDNVEYNISLAQNPSASLTIGNNQINCSQVLPISRTLTTGILLNKQGVASITDNIIKKVKNGIIASLTSDLTISYNSIELNAAPWNGNNPSSSYGKGIGVSACSNTLIENNDVLAANRNNWWVDGIRVSNSTNNTIRCNYMFKTASGLFFDGICNLTRVYKNNMRRNYWGFLVNNGMIGNQYAVPGNTGNNYASDNIWTGPYQENGIQYYHTNCLGNTDPELSKIYVRPNPGTPYLPDPFYAQPSTSVLYFNPLTNTVLTSVFTLNNQCENVDAIILNDDLPYTPAEIGPMANQVAYSRAAWEWWLKHGLYLEAKQKTEQNMDAELLAFKQENDARALGKLLEVQEKLADTGTTDSLGFASIKLLNDGIVPENNIETQFREMNDWFIRLREMPDTGVVFTVQEIEGIRNLALQCPLEFGPGVYMARAALAVIDSLPREYMNACEMAIPSSAPGNARMGLLQPYPPSHSSDEELDMLFEQNPLPGIQPNTHFAGFSIYPNPADLKLSIAVRGDDEIKDYEIYNTLGVMVAKQTTKSSYNEIAVHTLPNGMYTIKLCTERGGVIIQRFNVLH